VKIRCRKAGIAIHQDNERIRGLLLASIQIAEHMEESGSIQDQVAQMMQRMRQQAENLSDGAGPVSAEFSDEIAQVEQIVDRLRQHEREAYGEETDDNPARYESQSLEAQLDQSQAYHEKVDFKSLKKIKENLEQIRSISGS
jgi:hypothetical protein